MSQLSLHERLATELGWSLREVRSFSLLTLRELVRERNPKLAHLITDQIEQLIAKHVEQATEGDRG